MSCENRESILISDGLDNQEQQPSDKQVKSTSKKKRDTNVRGGKQAASKAESRGKTLFGTKKKPAKLALDPALMQTAESVAEAGKKLRLEQENFPGRKVGITDKDDEDSLFCQSLAKRMKQLSSQAKAFVRIQVEQIMFNVEFNGQSMFVGGVYGEDLPFSMMYFHLPKTSLRIQVFLSKFYDQASPALKKRCIVSIL